LLTLFLRKVLNFTAESPEESSTEKVLNFTFVLSVGTLQKWPGSVGYLWLLFRPILHDAYNHSKK